MWIEVELKGEFDFLQYFCLDTLGWLPEKAHKSHGEIQRQAVYSELLDVARLSPKRGRIFVQLGPKVLQMRQATSVAYLRKAACQMIDIYWLARAVDRLTFRDVTIKLEKWFGRETWWFIGRFRTRHFDLELAGHVLIDKRGTVGGFEMALKRSDDRRPAFFSVLLRIDSATLLLTKHGERHPKELCCERSNQAIPAETRRGDGLRRKF